MNINQLMRGLVGDAVPAESRALELKPGQTVRGVVLKTFDNQEALLQINGTQVMAKLETPLQVGQRATLQVQPDSFEGLIVLKQIESSGETSDTDVFFQDWGKNLNLPAKSTDSLDLVNLLRQAGVKLNQQTAQALKSAVAMMPEGTDPATWLKSTIAVLGRGLPVTQQTIAAMQQALSGPPAHQLLQQLESQLKAWLGNAVTADGGEGTSLTPASIQGRPAMGSASSGLSTKDASVPNLSGSKESSMVASRPSIEDNLASQAEEQGQPAIAGNNQPVKAIAARLLGMLAQGPALTNLITGTASQVDHIAGNGSQGVSAQQVAEGLSGFSAEASLGSPTAASPSGAAAGISPATSGTLTAPTTQATAGTSTQTGTPVLPGTLVAEGILESTASSSAGNTSTAIGPPTLADGSARTGSAALAGMPGQAGTLPTTGSQVTVGASASSGAPASTTTGVSDDSSALTDAQAVKGTFTAAQSQGASASGSNWIGSMLKWLGADHERNLVLQHDVRPQTASSSDTSNGNATATAKDSPSPTVSGQQSGVIASGERQETASANSLRTTGEVAVPTAGTAAASNVTTRLGDEKAVVNEVDSKFEVGSDKAFKTTNEHIANERESAIAAKLALPGKENIEAAVRSSLHPSSPQQTDAMIKQGQDSVKSLLMSLVTASDTPAALKETAQQLISQITGQQLLLAPERNGAFMSQVTLFVPLNSPDGQQTASVHIQSRRGKKGELDASNCRLLFDLSMKTIGETIVDVKVTDNIVNLQVLNDHPATALLIDTARDGLKNVLGNMGYQLLSLRTAPLPPLNSDEAPSISSGADKPEGSPLSSISYKGVDYRV